MLDASSAGDGEKPDFAIVSIYGTETPDCVRQAVRLKYARQGEQLVIGLSLAEGLEKFLPAIGAGGM